MSENPCSRKHPAGVASRCVGARIVVYFSVPPCGTHAGTSGTPPGLIKEHQVKPMLLSQFDGIFTVCGRRYIVSTLLKQHDMRPQHLDLVVNPQDALYIWHKEWCRR